MILLGYLFTAKDEFEFKETDISYYEFVYEDFGCKNDCFIEYIVHSNGVVFTKKETMADKGRKTEINLGTIDKNKAEDLINYTKKIIENLGTKNVNCADCRFYHIFYGSPRETKAFTTYFENAPEFIAEINAVTESALKEIRPLESFFVHFVFQPVEGNSIDYHFYPEGTVLKEEFGKKNGELLFSAIYFLDLQEINNLKKIVTDDYFISLDNLNDCNAANLLWGYLEIKKGKMIIKPYIPAAREAAGPISYLKNY